MFIGSGAIKLGECWNFGYSFRFLHETRFSFERNVKRCGHNWCTSWPRRYESSSPSISSQALKYCGVDGKFQDSLEPSPNVSLTRDCNQFGVSRSDGEL